MSHAVVDDCCAPRPSPPRLAPKKRPYAAFSEPLLTDDESDVGGWASAAGRCMSGTLAERADDDDSDDSDDNGSDGGDDSGGGSDGSAEGEVSAAPSVGSGRRAARRWAKSPLRDAVERQLVLLERRGVQLSAYGNAAAPNSLVTPAEYDEWRRNNTLFDMRRLERTMRLLRMALPPAVAYRAHSAYALKHAHEALTTHAVGGGGEYAMAALLCGLRLQWFAPVAAAANNANTGSNSGGAARSVVPRPEPLLYPIVMPTSPVVAVATKRPRLAAILARQSGARF